ncbi:type VII secretion protein EccE [Mycobacterium xenopi]|uniref:type VII secretion protein EccE n=1 Tax=Mycobacterium xenopi TaxID=1789 RepID=UPI000D969EB1|nr:type VII secretion protein EccE [Mycobacterium xenopi]SPX88397.1 type VII secretion protein EccE [Mycobacterium xenopi]
MTAPRSAGARAGFTKPPMLGVHISAWRIAVAAVLCASWIAASWGRLHPVLVAAVPLLVIAIVFTTIYHVTLTRWVLRWLAWRRHRRDPAPLPAADAVCDVALDGVAGGIGVVSENETLITMVELEPDPIAPTVVVENEERTINTLHINRLAAMLTLTDVKLSSIDVISPGHRAAGGFADLYQQMIGPVPAATHRRTRIVLRIALVDNLAAIARRGSDADAPRRTAAAACLRVADALAATGIDARPATAAHIVAANAVLHADAPVADHWSYLEGPASFTGIYYADPEHISDDAAQWWTWPASRDTTTLVRLTRTSAGTQIAALVRYRTTTRPSTPPVSRLGPLYGVQQAMWRQFRVGYVPPLAPIPWAPLADHDPAIAFGPTGPMIGFVVGPREKATAHLPLAGAITVLCQTSLLLRQLALRATSTGRPLIVVADDAQRWSPIVASAATGKLVEAVPEDVPEDAILVIEGQCPLAVPEVTVLTNDASRGADVELVDADDQYTFTLKTRSGLSARVRAVPTHEERRLLGVTISPPPAAPAAPRRLAAQPAPHAPATPQPPSPPAPAAPRSSAPATPAGAPAKPQQRPEQTAQPAAPQRPTTAPSSPAGNGESGRHRIPAEPGRKARVPFARGANNIAPPPEQHLVRGSGDNPPPAAHPPPPPGPTTTRPDDKDDPRWRKES